MTNAAPERLAHIFSWSVHGDGKTIAPGEVVKPFERLSWPRTIGLGAQHLIAMFGATFLVPLLTGFPPATTLFFSGIGTLLFLVVTAGRVPSYLGSSFAFIAPIAAAQDDFGPAGALGGVLVAGVLLFLVGLVVQWVGSRWINVALPPVVTGSIVALIGLNLAPTTFENFEPAPVTGTVTIVGILLCMVLFRGLLGRLSILLGVALGYVAAVLQGELSPASVKSVADAPWVGLPTFQGPSFHPEVFILFIPVVLVLVAENLGHVKSVALMTGTNLDPVTGRALMADGAATALAGLGGGSGTTTYAENIGVMAATRVYSTAAYWVAGILAVLLSLSPKVGAAIATIPAGVLGGAGVVLYGMIGILGVRIWVQNKVNFADPVNLMVAAVPLVIGIADFQMVVGQLTFGGIALGTAVALLIYHVLTPIARWRGTAHPQDATRDDETTALS